MKGVNWQLDKGGTAPHSIPIIVCLPDWAKFADYDFSHLQVAAFRFVGDWQEALNAPKNAHVILWNENDDSERSWRSVAVATVRAKRPDLIIHYGAEAQGLYPKDEALSALCDVVDFHLAVTKPLPVATWNGKSVWVTEYELTPGSPEWDTVASVAAAAPMPFFAWGADVNRADVLDHLDILTALVALNNKGETLADSTTPAADAAPLTGSGVTEFCQKIQATPLSHEEYLGDISITVVEMADSAGTKVQRVLIYDKLTNQVYGPFD